MIELGTIVIGSIHVLAAVAFVGGAFYADRIMAPVAAKLLEPPVAGRLSQATGQRFTILAWTAAVLLILTGLVRAWGRGVLNLDDLLNTSYGNVVLAKIVLSAVLVFVGILILRKAIALSKLAASGPPPPPEMGATQAHLILYTRVNLTVAAIIVVLAVAARVIAPASIT